MLWKKIFFVFNLVISLFGYFVLSSTSFYIWWKQWEEIQKEARKIVKEIDDVQKRKLAEKCTNWDVGKLEAMISDGKAGPITMCVLKSCVKLNTDIPGVWQYVCNDSQNKFWVIMWWLMKLLINFVVAVAFIALIASWVMMMLSWVNQSTAWKWKELLKKVVIWIVLLGLSGLILHTINPNFFK